MGRNLSPALRQELAKLKDADCRRSAMKALKLYVKDMDSKAIPQFLAQVSETKDAGSSPGEYTISIYEVLARVHGPNIVPQLDNIMSSIIKTLTTSGGSFPLQQACSKVVPAIARYGIESATPEDKKQQLIHSLCKPLTDALLGSQESLSCGAALCLKALVDCDNWRFASDEMVNEVCLKLASALEDKSTQTNSHMGLVMSLAKRNCLTVEAYARLLIRAGLNILNCGLTEKNSQKRLTAIQMVHSLMKCLDIRSIFSELDSIIVEMENCQSDQMPYVKGAAFEALQTAKKLLVDQGSKISCDEVSMTGSNFSRSSNSRRQLSSPGSQSPSSVSPESQTFDSFGESFMDSPMSVSQASCNGNHIRRNLNRKQWSQENGYVNVSLKDGLFSELAQESVRSHVSSEQDEGSDSRRSYTNGFPGFIPGTPVNGSLRSRPQSPSNGAFRRRAQSPANGTLRSRQQSPSNGAFRRQAQSPANGALRSRPQSPSNGALRRRAQSPANGALRSRPQTPVHKALRSRSQSPSMRSQTPSPQRTRSQINLDYVKIFTTPRKLVRSLQDNDENSDYFGDQSRRQRSPCSANCEWSPVVKYNQSSCLNKNRPQDGTGNMTDGCEDHQSHSNSNSESVSSTQDVLAMANGDVSLKLFHKDQSTSEKIVKIPGRNFRKMSTLVLLIVLVFSLGFASVLLLGDQGEFVGMVPT
ncbi:TORTIFOLIA1-like protein 2 isoform X2 [Chenopodium quinoa]|uniref:TORTIFOLIA1/SINE1-2 N-terminal domain-containing protein n=2 Tax=Chenopodium quinoa TaxID=63459 RepID=A0A803MMA0_CHEQI|nr:TORTIFOLIA1-like protein 2 isoform X2 [Chenopodium quinoa]